MKCRNFILVILMLLQEIAFGDPFKIAALKAVEQNKTFEFAIGDVDLKINPKAKEGDIESLIVRIEKSLQVTDGDDWKDVNINEFEVLLVDYMSAANQAGVIGNIVLEINSDSEGALFEAVGKVIGDISKKYPMLRPINEIGVRKLQGK